MDFSRFFTDLFTELSSSHSWLVILYLVGAFLIGFITAWLIWRRKWKNVQLKLEALRREHSNLNARFEEQARALELKEADLKKAELEIEQLKARIRQLDEEKGNLHSDLVVAKRQLRKAGEEKNTLLEKERDYLSRLDDFDSLVLGLKTKNQNLAVKADENSNALDELAQLQGRFNTLNAQHDSLLEEKAQLEEQQQVAFGNSAETDARMAELEEENKRLRNESEANSAMVNTHADYLAIQDKVTALETENEQLRKEVEHNDTVLNTHTTDYLILQDKVAALEAENETLRAESVAVIAGTDAMEEQGDDMIADHSDYAQLHNQVAELEAENEKLRNESEHNSATMDSYSDYLKLKEQVEELEMENAKLMSDLQDSRAINEATEDYNALQVKIADLAEENADLKSRLAILSSRQPRTQAKDVNFAASLPSREPSKEEAVSVAEAKVKAALGKKVAVASPGDKDDLKMIVGIGPFIEKKLNHLGIYTFEQVSQFDDEFSDQVTEAIEFFPGRIQRDDWKGQAKTLLGQKNAGSLGKDKKRPKSNDLKVVEGIGPKIEGLLKADGIDDWTDLAAADFDRLKGILNAAGDRYRMHDPTTWPQQAGLAAKGLWDALDTLQDELKGGRKA